MSTMSTSSNFSATGCYIDRTSNTFAGIKLPITLIVFVPGNPGSLGLYHDFLEKLFRQISSFSYDDKNHPTILAISHNDFDHPEHVGYKIEHRIRLDESDFNLVEKGFSNRFKDTDPYHIELQVFNKLLILKRLLRIDLSDCKLIFVGHSIGCYVIMRLLQDKTIAAAHIQSIFLHPALENMAITPKGMRFDRIFWLKLDYVGHTFAFMLHNLLPQRAKLAIARWFCPQEFMQSASSLVLESLTHLACFKTFRALVRMAKSELTLIKEIDAERWLGSHIPKLKMIFAINDGWVNEDYRIHLRRLFPSLWIEEQAVPHAFIMKPDLVTDYAIKVSSYIQNLIEIQRLQNSSSESSTGSRLTNTTDSSTNRTTTSSTDNN